MTYSLPSNNNLEHRKLEVRFLCTLPDSSKLFMYNYCNITKTKLYLIKYMFKKIFSFNVFNR